MRPGVLCPASAWIHADDGFDRSRRTAEAHYFHTHGEVMIDVPAGIVSVEILHGLERKFEQRRVVTRRTGGGSCREYRRGYVAVPGAGHWVSADVTCT